LRPRLTFAEQEDTHKRDPMVMYAAGFVVDNKRTGRREGRIPRESSNPVDFASGCWFCQGSTMLFRKETFDAIGPCDTGLRRLQDLDWFLRYALAGGKLKVWDRLVAVVETGPKPSLTVLEGAAKQLRIKYLEASSPHHLPQRLIRRLEAYLDL